MASTNQYPGLDEGAIGHVGEENVIADGAIQMGSCVELVQGTLVPGELVPRVVEATGDGSSLAYGIAIGGDEDGSYGDGSGVDATATATLDIPLGEVNFVFLQFNGFGYTSIPKVVFDNAATNGSGAAAEAVLTDGVVTSINVTNGGSLYTSAPKVIIDPSSDISTRATSKAGQTVKVVTRGRCLGRVSGLTAIFPGSDLTILGSLRPGVMRNATQGTDVIAESLALISNTADFNMIPVEVVKKGIRT